MVAQGLIYLGDTMKRFFAAVLLSLCFALLSASLNASAAPKPPQALPSFSVRYKFASGGESCETRAAQVAVAVETAGKLIAPELKNVQGVCQARLPLVGNADGYTADVIVVTYQAKFALYPYRAIFGGSTFIDDAVESAGLYPTYADCLAAMEPQTRLFQAETTLLPIGAYCTATHTEFHPGYSLTIESVGTPKRSLRVYSEDRYRSTDDRTEILQAVADAVIAAKGTIAYRDARLVFYYSGGGGVRINVTPLGYFRDLTQCTSQKDEAQSIFVKAGMRSVRTFCQVNGGDTAYPSWSLTSVSEGYSVIHDDFGTHSPRYDTFEECRLDLNRIVDQLASSGRPPFGGLCLRTIGLNEGFAVSTYSRL
jgi:hypothetical protein